MLDVGGGDWTPPGELLAQVFPSPPPPRPVNDVPPGPMPIAPVPPPAAMIRPVRDVAPGPMPAPILPARAIGPIALPPAGPPSPVVSPIASPQSPDAIARNIAATDIPFDKAGFTPEFVRKWEQVGFGPQARYASQPDPYGYPRFEATRAADTDVPPDYLAILKEGAAMRDSAATRRTLPSGNGELNAWEKQPSGRPTTTRMGMPEGQGGLGQPGDQTWKPSNVVMKQALKELPPVFQRYKNLKISRPVVSDTYGSPSNIGGWYSGADKPIAVGRGAATEPDNPNPDRGSDPEVGVAKHELLHALSYELPPYKDDAANDFKALGQAIAADRPALEGAPAYRNIVSEIGYFGAKNDWGHVWTAIAMQATKGMRLPPALQAYFAPMMAPAGTP